MGRCRQSSVDCEEMGASRGHLTQVGAGGRLDTMRSRQACLMEGTLSVKAWRQDMSRGQ